MTVIVTDTSILSSPASPIIFKTKSGTANSVAQDYYDIELSHQSLRRGGGPASRLYNDVTSLSIPTSILLQNKGLPTMTSFAIMPDFDYVVGVWGGPDVLDIASDSRVETMWRDTVSKRILSTGIPYAIAGPDYTYSVKTSRSAVMNFTSLQEIRRLVGADVANSKGYTGKGVNAVDIDTGGHKLNPMTTRLKKYTTIPGFYTDECSHGEWTASAMGGTKATDRTFSRANPTKQPVVNEGMAPESNLMEIKSLGFVVGTGSDSMLLKGLAMALSLKADTVNCSWGGTVSSTTPELDPYYIPMQKLKDSNAIVCVASGDSGPGTGTCDSPGSLPNVLTVGSINAVSNAQSMFGKAGYASGFSSRGPVYGQSIKPDTTSYGAIIDGAIGPVLDASYTHVVHSYQAIAGTSMSTPIVNGLVTLMKQLYRDTIGVPLTLDEIFKMLSSMGHKKNNTDGWGMLTWPMIEEWVKLKYGVAV